MKNLYLLLLLLLLAPISGFSQYNTRLGTGSGTNGYGTFLGYYAGNLTTGGWNTFVGIEAGRNTTNGGNNTFVGHLSGYQNTSGGDNSFFGKEAGVYYTDGSKNTFIGAYAGRGVLIVNGGGTYNTFVGYQSGYKSGGNTDRNTFLGSGSGHDLSTGDNNTFIGYNAGYNNNGSTNVFLGYYAGYNETGSNKLYIDNSSTSAPLIYGDFSANLLKVNGRLEITNHLQLNGGGYIDDDATIGGNSDDWMRLNGYIEMKSNTDNYGLLIRDQSQDGYLALTAKNNQAYLSESTSSSNYFLRANGTTSYFGGQVVTPRTGISGTYNSTEVQGIWSIGAGWSIDETNNDFGNQYGIVYAHTNSGQGISGWGHQIMFVNNGTYNSAISLSEGNAYFKGNLGLGTTNPSQKLHVEGSTYTDMSLILGNQERSYVTGTAGEIYFDQNCYPDYSAFTGSNGGGLSILTEDGWGAVIATNNMQWITPTFDGGVFTSEVAFNGGIKGNSAGGALKVQTDYGYVQIGPTNSSWAHFYTDRPKYYFDKPITINQGILSSYDEDLQLQTSGTTGLTISNTDGDVTIENNLLVNGSIQFDASALEEDNSEDDLMVVRGDGSMGTRSVKSIESPWMFEEFFNGQDTIACVRPDSSMVGNVFIDVIDLNGNIRMGDNAYLDDDTDFGDEGTPDDWMRFNDQIEFRSSGNKKGIVLYDASTFLDYTNIYQEAGTTYLSNGSDADNYFISATGRDVTFGGNVTLSSMSGGDQFTTSSSSTLYLAMDEDNDSEGAGETNVISFGRNGAGVSPNYDELMRLEEDGSLFINNLPASTDLINMMVVDENNQVHIRDVNTLKLSPWDDMGSDITFTRGDVAIGGATIPAGYKLAVDGKIVAEELKVELSETWPDYVFESDYDLMPIEELKAYVDEEKHLPNVSAKETVEEEGGVNIGEMNQKLLEKVEELTLYMIQEHERVSTMEKELAALKAENQKLKQQIKK